MKKPTDIDKLLTVQKASGIQSVEERAELHIVIDQDGIRLIQIIGRPEAHEGHDLYFKIQDLILDFDKAIKAKLNPSQSENRAKSHADKGSSSDSPRIT